MEYSSAFQYSQHPLLVKKVSEGNIHISDPAQFRLYDFLVPRVLFSNLTFPDSPIILKEILENCKVSRVRIRALQKCVRGK